MRSIPFSVNLLVAGLVSTTPVLAQRVVEPSGTFPEPFSQVVGIRQLSDGRLIIADRLEKHVSYIDFDRGTLRQIGGEGSGPGEYQTPTSLMPYPADGTLLTDFGNMRISLIDRDGRINQSWPMMKQSDDGSVNLIRPSVSDRSGNVYFANTGVMMRRRGSDASVESDSSYLLRYNMEAETTDTVAALYNEPINSDGQQAISFSGGAARISGAMRPYRAQDGWTVAPDGRIAVVRATDYRLDWVNTDGTLVRGRSNAYDPIRIGQAEKEAWASQMSSGSFNMVVAGGSSGSGSRSFSLPTPDIDDVEFPEFMPPFGNNAVSISPNGDIWVQLNRAADATSPLFDIFNSRGEKVQQIQLGENRRLVGFGNDAFYAVSIDEDELQWLERYPYPARR